MSAPIKTIRVLLVDDDEEEFFLTQRLLRSVPESRFDVHWVPSAEGAMEAVAHRPFDICLLDLYLGPECGIEFLHRLIASGFSAPVIVLTGRADYGTDKLVSEAGAYDYLPKGRIDGATLERSMRYALQRKAAKQKIAEQQAQLFSSSKLAAIGEMAAGVAHEINNPLTIIQGYAKRAAELIRKGDGDEAVLQYLKRIDDTTDRIAKIVKGLRSFASDDSDEPFEPFRLTDVIEETLTLCRERFKSHGVDIKVEISGDPVLDCRPIQVSQVLLNLLNNAFDALDRVSEKRIVVKAEDGGDVIELSVTDNGRGVAPGHRAKIMQPFFTTKEVGKGTGLGLSISKGIVESHRGELVLDPKSEQTRFVVTLPKSQPLGTA